MSNGRMNSVSWSEGMFLRPHHLQHHDVWAEARLNYHLRGIDPFHWGVRSFVVDEDALSDNRFVIQQLDAVLPGGMIVRYPNGNADVQVREFDPTTERLSVHFGVRNLRPTEPNSAHVDESNRDVRCFVATEELPDLNRGGFAADVEVSRLNVRLFFSGEDQELELYESIKLAEVVATGELKQPFALSRSYAPPLLSVQAFQPLSEEVTQIVSQIAAKVRVVAGRIETISTLDLPRMWMRYTLARMTPVLRHLLSTGETRPFDLYGVLVETAAALAAFDRPEPIELPNYQHEDLQTCFHELIALIDAQLEETLPQRFHEIPLRFDKARKLYVNDELSVERVDPRNSFFLGIKPPSNIDSRALVGLVKEHARAGSATGVKELDLLNRGGLGIEHMAGAPTEIASRAGYEYFKVVAGGPQWKKVREEFSFAIKVSEMEEANVFLYVVQPES